MSAIVNGEKVSKVKGAKGVKAPRPKVDPEVARKAIEAQIEKLRKRLDTKVTELAVESNPAVAAIESKLKGVMAKLGATNRLVALRAKRLATLEKDARAWAIKVDILRDDQAALAEQRDALQVELETAKAGLTPAK